MSFELVKENSLGARIDVTLKEASLDKNAVCQKLTPVPVSPRPPLVERMDNASKRRDKILCEKKQKAAVDIENKHKKVQEKLDQHKEKTTKLITERVKSADSKRKSLIDERVIKAQADVEKAKKISAEMKQEREGQLKSLEDKIVEKVTKANENHAKHIEKRKSQASAHMAEVLKTVETVEKKQAEEKARALRKEKDAHEKRMQLIEEERTRLKAKHEKVERLAQSKKNADPNDPKVIAKETEKILRKKCEAHEKREKLLEEERLRLKAKHEKVKMIAKNKKNCSTTEE